MGVCPSLRHRIAVDNPTDGRESADGTQPSYQGEFRITVVPPSRAGLIDLVTGIAPSPLPACTAQLIWGSRFPPSRDLFG